MAPASSVPARGPLATLHRGTPLRTAAVVGLGLMVAACTVGRSGSTESQGRAPAPTAASSVPGATTTVTVTPTGAPGAGDWPTYQHDARRSGVGGGRAAAGHIALRWRSPAFDADVYAQPLVVGATVVVATEQNSLYAVDTTTGAVRWQTNLGAPVSASSLPCGNIDPSGITATPVVDPERGTVYAVGFLAAGPHHELVALDLATGTVRWRRTIDPPGLDPTVEQQRGALTLANGRVYVPFGGLYGDCGRYRGAVVSAAADGSGVDESYVVASGTGAGIWNPAGAAVDGAGDLYVTTGNSGSTDHFDFGNAVIRLDPDLALRDYFAPLDWARRDAHDIDLGSTGALLLPGGGVLVAGKDGTAQLLATGALGHVAAPSASAHVCAGAYGAGALDGTVAYLPCTDALVAIRTESGRPEVIWRTTAGTGPPIVAAGLVWSLRRDGTLIAVHPGTGRTAFSAELGKAPSRFTAPSADAGSVYVAADRTLTAFATG